MIAVITGASRGIGKAIAEALIAEGWDVIALSRTPSPVAGVRSIACDITDADAVKEAFSGIERADVLINNAGFGISGAAECTDMGDVRDQFGLNVFAHVQVTQAALPLLRASKGRIVNITSAAAVFAIPFQSFYSATKSAMETFSFALANELHPFGVRVCAVRLGDVKTGFTAARRKSEAGDDGLYGGAIARSVAVMEHDEQHGMAPETIARAVVKLLHKKRMPVLVTVGLKYKALCVLGRLLPTGLINTLLRMMYVPKK